MGGGGSVRHRVIGTFSVVVLIFSVFFFILPCGCGKFKMTRFSGHCCCSFFNYPVRLLICGFNAQVPQIGKKGFGFQGSGAGDHDGRQADRQGQNGSQTGADFRHSERAGRHVNLAQTKSN